MFPQIKAIHVKANITCRGELRLLSGDGESGEGFENPFYCQCRKCGETGFFNEETIDLGCPMVYSDEEDLLEASRDNERMYTLD